MIRLLLLPVFFVMGGCVPLLLGGGLATGYMAAQERGIEAAAKDTALKTEIVYKLSELDAKSLANSTVLVQRGDVVLAGTVPTGSLKRRFDSAIRSIKGVRRFYNHLEVMPADIKDYSKDAWITARLRADMLTDKKVFSINYHYTTVAGSVYVLGIAQNRTEKNAVLHYARRIKGVVAVHDFVTFK